MTHSIKLRALNISQSLAKNTQRNGWLIFCTVHCALKFWCWGLMTKQMDTRTCDRQHTT